jgi:hypothetical protein
LAPGTYGGFGAVLLGVAGLNGLFGAAKYVFKLVCF